MCVCVCVWIIMCSYFMFIGPPDVPSDVKVWSSGSRSISVSWVEGFNGGSEQTFIVQYRESTSTKWTNIADVFSKLGLLTNHTAVISNLEPKTKYLVRVLAYNKVGSNEFTDEKEAEGKTF